MRLTLRFFQTEHLFRLWPYRPLCSTLHGPQQETNMWVHCVVLVLRPQFQIISYFVPSREWIPTSKHTFGSFFFLFLKGFCFRLQHFLETLCHCWDCAADFQWEEKRNPERYSRLGVWGCVSLSLNFFFSSLGLKLSIFFLLTGV